MPVLTVHNLAGENCWGPSEVALDHTVAQLREDIAQALQKPAVSLRLLKKAELLSEGLANSLGSFLISLHGFYRGTYS